MNILDLKRVLFFLPLFIFQNLCAQNLSGKQKKAIDKIDSYLSTEFPANEPGAVILVSQNSQILYKKAFGLSNLNTKKDLHADDIMPIASMTKQFTAVATLILSEQNKLSLSDSIQKYIPEFPSKKYTITIEHLLAQTSGIREYFDVDEGDTALLLKEYLPLQVIDYFKNDPLEFEPNTQFRYSNSNYFLLGLVIERVSGRSFGQFLTETIFEPLKMRQTSYWYTDNTTKENIAVGYSNIKGEYKPAIRVNGSIWYSSGGITSTVDDLYKWTTSLFNGALLKSNERLTRTAVFKNGQPSAYSFGFFTRTLQGSPTIQHGGNLYGFTSSGLYLPKEDIYVAILSNRGFKPTEEIANYIASEMLEKPVSLSNSVKIDYEKLVKYTGTYELASGKKRLMKIFIVSDRLVLSFPEQKGAEVDILPVGGDRFESKKVKAVLDFIRDGKGNITGIIVDQKGKTEWNKISD